MQFIDERLLLIQSLKNNFVFPHYQLLQNWFGQTTSDLKLLQNGEFKARGASLEDMFSQSQVTGLNTEVSVHDSTACDNCISEKINWSGLKPSKSINHKKE